MQRSHNSAGRRVVHLYRNVTAAEALVCGPVRDIRGTDEHHLRAQVIASVTAFSLDELIMSDLVEVVPDVR